MRPARRSVHFWPSDGVFCFWNAYATATRVRANYASVRPRTYPREVSIGRADHEEESGATCVGLSSTHGPWGAFFGPETMSFHCFFAARRHYRGFSPAASLTATVVNRVYRPTHCCRGDIRRRTCDCHTLTTCRRSVSGVPCVHAYRVYCAVVALANFYTCGRCIGAIRTRFSGRGVLLPRPASACTAGGFGLYRGVPHTPPPPIVRVPGA